ncbi:ribonuclease H-like domain-containing protein [Tanacetum coccineum]
MVNRYEEETPNRYQEMKLAEIIASLHHEFSMTDLGSLSYFLGIFVVRDSSRMFSSQRNVVYLSSNPVQHLRTKHIDIHIHFIRDLVDVGQVRLLHVLSRYQYADIFTNGLPSAFFEEFRTSLSIQCPPTQTAEEC